MKQNYLRDQRGVAMLLELILVASVLALVGVAIYQSAHRGQTATTQSSSSAPATVTSLASSAAAVGQEESATDATLGASTGDTLVGEVGATDNDVTNLGGGYDATAF